MKKGEAKVKIYGDAIVKRDKGADGNTKGYEDQT